MFHRYALLFAAVAALSTTPAWAQYPGCNAGLGGAYGFGISGSLYGLGRIPVPPYFALHPPVYYSYPVPRTYGHSPFAYPGTFRTPEIYEAAPEVIVNPHVAPSTNIPASDEAKDRVASLKNAAATPRPKLIANPFVGRANDVRVAADTR